MPARRIVYLFLPTFATDRIGRIRPQDGPGPFATLTASRGRRVLMAVNAAAQAEGLTPGQGLADARALYPRLAVAAHDRAATARSLAAVADWCLRYTPWTAPDPLPATGIGGDAGVWLDISGCAHLFADGSDTHGEAALIADLTNRLGRAGFKRPRRRRGQSRRCLGHGAFRPREHGRHAAGRIPYGAGRLTRRRLAPAPGDGRSA